MALKGQSEDASLSREQVAQGAAAGSKVIESAHWEATHRCQHDSLITSVADNALLVIQSCAYTLQDV